jgi:hypothetical protein
MKQLLTLLICTISVAVLAQETSFPKSFVGTWEGTLNWYKANNPSPQSIGFKVVFAPTDTANHYIWQLKYADQPVRDYLLKPVDQAKGHWVIDERNGILLDQFWVGNQLTGTFSVAGSTILNTYRLEKKQLVVEFHTLATNAIRKSGSGENLVDAFKMLGYQKAILRKVK